MIGAFLDLGLSFEDLQSKLDLLPLEGYRISSQKCMRSGIHATKFDVDAGHSHSHRGFTDIRKMIESSGLSPWVKEKSVEMLIEEECGDLFFALICLTNFLGINLETALLKSLTKYDSRKK